MADFAEDSTIRLRLVGTHLPALSLDNLPTIPRNEWVEVSGDTAKNMLALAEAKPELPHEEIEVEVVEPGSVEQESAEEEAAEEQDAEKGAVDATGAAEELAEKHGLALAGVDGSGKDGRITKPDVESVISE